MTGQILTNEPIDAPLIADAETAPVLPDAQPLSGLLEENIEQPGDDVGQQVPLPAKAKKGSKGKPEPLDFANNPDFKPLGAERPSEGNLDFSKNPDFKPLDAPSIETGVEAGIQGGVKGLVEGTSLSAGIAAGAKAGVLATAAIPVPGARIVGGTLGALMGAGLSMYAARTALEQLEKVELPSGSPLTFSDFDEVPTKNRVAFAFGETAGNGAAYITGTTAFAKTGVRVLSDSFVGKVVNGILDNAAKHTKVFLAKEGVAVAGSAAGGAIAEALLPGDKLARFGGELTGGVLAPGKSAISASVWLRGKVSQWVKIFSRSAQETEAARIIQSAFKESGDDIVLTAKLLEDSLSGVPKTPATVAQTVANDATIGLETAVGKLSRSAELDVNDAADASYEVLRKTVELLKREGNPTALREAATVQSRYFFTVLSDRANAAKLAALKAAEKLPATNANKAELSRQAFEAADTALTQSRGVEAKLWELVPSDIEGTSANILRAFKDVRASVLPRTPVPPLVKKTLEDIASGEQQVTTGFLKTFRSQMLAEARKAAVNPDNATDARFYGHLAEAALEDIDTIFKGPKSGVLRAVNIDTEAYDTARRFTASLHDAFTNSYTGKTLAEGRQGLRQPPEILLSRAFAGGDDLVKHRLVELEESVRFLPDMQLGGQEALDNAQLMVEAQERFFSILAHDTGSSGAQKVKFMREFLRKHPTLAKRFPNETKFIKELADAEEGVVKTLDALKNGTKTIEKRAAFARFSRNSKFESPVDAMAGVFGGPSPSRELTSLARMSAKKGGEVQEGFKATVIDYAMREATRPDNSTDFVKLRRLLTEPLSAGKPSAVQIMLDSGAMNSADVKQLTSVLDMADTVLKAQTRGAADVVIEEASEGFQQLFIRAHGAKTAGKMFGESGGAQLIIAAGGAKLSEQIIARTPNAKVAKIVTEAMLDKELFIALSRKAVSDVEKFSAAMALNSILVRLGMRPVTPLGTATFGAVNDMTEGGEPEAMIPLEPQPIGADPDMKL
jgi:hypothetical protein